MEITRFTEAAPWYARAAPFLLRHEAEHAVLLGVGAELRHQLFTFGPQQPYLAVVADQGAVVAAALMTPPHALAVSLASPPAVSLIAADLASDHPTLSGVVSQVEVSAAFVTEWQRLRGQPARRTTAIRMYQLTRLRPVRGVAGRLRPATPADRDLLVAWIGVFMRETHGDASDSALMAARWLESPTRTMYLWENGGPVCMAGVNGPTEHGIRISSVYTPLEQRRRG